MAMTSSSGRGVKNYVLQNFPLLQKDIYIYIYIFFFTVYYCSEPNSVAARSNAWVYGRSLVGIVGSKPAGDMDVCFGCCMLSGRGLWDGLITRLENSYRL